MKNDKVKRILAIAGIVLLLVLFCLPMVNALSGDFQMGYFMASLMSVIFVPIMLFAILGTYRMLHKKRVENQNPMIENIIFDVGEVLVDFDWDGFINSFGFPDAKKKRIVGAIFKDHIWDERDRGLYEDSYYVDKMVENAPDLEKEIREVMRLTPKTIGKREYALTWVKYLKNQGYHLYVLSNFCEYMLEELREEMDFLEYMDGIMFSCEAKELKPEDGIYQKLIRDFQLKPEKSVFIDDRKENCMGAERNGIHTIQFQSFRQTAAELEKKYGVK